MLRTVVFACALLAAPIASACDNPMDCGFERADRKRMLELAEQERIDRSLQQRMQDNYEAQRHWDAVEQQGQMATTNSILLMPRY